ncbi:MAG: hypothetical protein M0Z53_07425 [Thermaerobacter sp.]|nr:hypothetical protein [Thermaerobacter sp.]
MRNLDGLAPADSASPAAERGRSPRKKIWNLSQRVGQSTRPGFQDVAGLARSAFRVKSLPTEGVLFYGGVGFGVVGFVLAALRLPASGWLGFGIILVLGAIYWQGRLPDGSQPDTQTEGKEMTQ